MFQPVAIVGRACLLPGAHTPDELWRLVSERRVVIRPAPEGYWRAGRNRMLSSGACVTDAGGFVEGFGKLWNPALYPVDPEILADLDPLVHWLLHTGREALLDAGIAEPRRTKIGVVAGNLTYPTEALVDLAQAVYFPEGPVKKRGPLNRFSSGFPVHLMCDALGLTAGGYAIDAACASSLYAIKLASDWLHCGRADVMLAGAVNRCDGLMIHAGFTALRALSPSGQSRPFHRHADGLIPAEGAAVVVLKRLADAIDAGDRILGVIRGIGLSNDGRTSGILTPSHEGQIRAMQAAYAQAGISPRDISLVECHATGTMVGDATELRSMASVFEGIADLPIGSLKSNLGHLVTVSGVAGVLKVVDAINRGVRPATAGSGPLTESLSGTPFRLLREEEPWEPAGIRRAAVSSFGFGGNNAHLLIEQYTPGRAYPREAAPSRSPVAVVALAAQAADGRGTDDFISDLIFGSRRIGESATEIALSGAGLVFPPRDLERALAQQTLLLRVVGEALSDAGTMIPEETSVLIGLQCDAEATRPVIRLALRDLFPDEAGIGAWEDAVDRPMDAARVVGCMPNIPANRINRQFSLNGPGFAIAAEELSGIRALEIAIDGLRSGEIQAAVVGASDLCVEPVHRQATQDRPGDAACVMLLKRAEDALRDGNRILAIVDTGAGGPDAGRDSGISKRVRDCFGKAHAASGLLDVAAAVAAIDRSALPGAVPLLPGSGPHRLVIRTDATGGQSAVIRVMEEPERPATSRRGSTAASPPGIFLYSGGDLPELEDDGRLAIVAAQDELPERLALARSFLSAGPQGRTSPEGVFFRAGRMDGELAYVFTGAAAAYAGMGRELVLAMPELAGQVARENIVDLQSRAGWIYKGVGEPSDFEQLCGASFLCQVHARFTSHVLGLRPRAAIGLSSGETNALYALGAWSGIGELLDEIEACGLYTRILAGKAEALEGRSWTHYRVSAPAHEVQAAIEGEPSVFVTIVNAPGDLVIGGDPSACGRIARRLGSHRCARLSMELAVHCPAVQPAAQLWRRLHTRPTAQPAGIRFYANALGASYALTSDSVADALTQQALETVDFPRIIRAAWNDGVRIFVEHGSRSQLTQAIRTTLGDRPHLAVSLDASGRSSLRQALYTAAELWCAGVTVDMAALQTKLDSLRAPEPETGAWLKFAAHPPFPAGPARTFVEHGEESDAEVFVMAAAPRLAPLLDQDAPEPVPEPVAVAGNGLAGTVLAMHSRMSESHRLHVAEMARLQDAFLKTEIRLLRFLGPGDAIPVPNGKPSKPAPDRVTRGFTRNDLERLASGRIADVFGDAFRGQDGFARQVRMPEPPLLLVDRVVDLTGEPNSLGLGSIVTETCVTPDAWYLHQGYMPAAFAVESGQADLLLISWLGIDRFNRGRRVYRLLGCDLVFHEGLPKAGETLRYDIHVDGHASHGDVRMFFFHYDCRVEGKTRLSVRDGQAGFFTDEELVHSEGVLWSAESAEPSPEGKARPAAGPCPAPRGAFSAAQVQSFAQGRTADCFGEAFARACAHTRSPRIQTGRLLLIDSIPVFDPAGGPWERGYLRAESPVSPEDWFFAGHFKNDPCMPGTLMLEGCLQAMAFCLTGLGFTLERDGWRFEPVPEQTYQLRCRGQVLPSSKLLTYEIFVDEVVAGPLPTLYADVLCTVDGLKAFHCRRLGVRLVPDWPLEERRAELLAVTEPKPVAVRDGFQYGYHSLLSCALGRPSDAFGPAFARFDGPLRLPRLPSPPYHFMTRVIRVEESIHRPIGSIAEIEYDILPDAWYFLENGYHTMPPAVLIEHLLQPCGWLASFARTWFNTTTDVFFRNLDGAGTILSEVGPEAGCLRTTLTMKTFAEVAGMSIFSFDIRCVAGHTPVFEGSAVFGNFNAAALEKQTGLPVSEDDAAWFREDCSVGEQPALDVPRRDTPRLATGRLRMIDRITGFWPAGGAAGLGRIRAEKDIDERQWFFKAHFFNDPVQPGSLGIEAMVQTLETLMIAANLHAGIPNPRFEQLATDAPVSWTFRGQVLPHTRRLTVLVEIVEAAPGFARAAASLWADDKKIYAVPSLAMRIVPGTLAEEEATEILDADRDSWLRDHCPTYTIPALPMMSVADRLASAVARANPGLKVIGMRDIGLRRWIAFAFGPRRLKTEVKRLDSFRWEATLSVWRKAAHASLSRFDEAATGQVELADRYPGRPDPLGALEAEPVPGDPYETGELFHGPAFRIMRSLRRSAEGASFLLDAAAGTVPHGLLCQGLLDGMTHGIPNDNLHLWSDRIPAGVVGYPARIRHLSLFAPPPLAGLVRCEVRFAGFEEGAELFPRFKAQLIFPPDGSGHVWAEAELVYALYPKGPLGRADAPSRRSFLKDRQYVPNMLLGSRGDAATTVGTSDILESDWLPGTIQAAFDLRTADRAAELASKQHVAQTIAVHPSAVIVSPDYRYATCPRFPLSVFPLEVVTRSSEASARLAGTPYLNLDGIRAFWRSYSGVPDWPIEDLYLALIERFVRRVEMVDPAGFSALHGRPVLYIANHQVALESMMFNVLLSALARVPIRIVAKTEHRKTWMGQLIELTQQYPGIRQPSPILFFDRSRPDSIFEVFREFRDSLAVQPASLMIHAEGTRALSCRTPLSRLSSVFVDFALELGMPIVPGRFVGGLPVEPVTERLELPWQGGQQDVVVGKAIESGELLALPLGERSQRVLAAINGLTPLDEQPLPPSSGFPAPSANVFSMLSETLRLAATQGTATRALLAGEIPQSEWLRTFGAWLKSSA